MLGATVRASGNVTHMPSQLGHRDVSVTSFATAARSSTRRPPARCHDRYVLSVAEAIFGLVGVIVGAAIAIVGDFIIERRRESSLGKRAARLVHAELLSAISIVGGAAHEEVPFPGDKNEQIETTAWTDYKHDLALTLPSAAWSQVTLAYGAIEALNQAARAKQKLVGPVRPIDNLAWLTECSDDIARGVAAIRGPAEFEEPDESEDDDTDLAGEFVLESPPAADRASPQGH